MTRRALALAASAVAAVFAGGAAGGRAGAETPVPPPVAVVVDGRLPLGTAELPVFTAPDWSRPLPEVRRAVIVIHGYERNAADYARNMMALGPPPDTLVIAPQFLAPEDMAAHRLPESVLRWDRERWSDGEPALGPAPLSAFDGIDAILARLADRSRFANLASVVVAGFSAGGQIVQRYAIVGRGQEPLDRAGIRVRYVVGSPSSYAYFSDLRPLPAGGFAPFADAAACPGFNRWKYGFAGGLPPYAAAAASLGLRPLEQRYAARDIVYLAGADDDDPNHRFLDKSCAGEAQGPNRLARMSAFFALLQQSDGALLRQQMHTVAGAAHNAARVLGSPCGRAALFGDASCSD